MGTRRPTPSKTAAKRPKGSGRDWLAEWVAAAGLPTEVQEAVVSWLAKELVADQNARLEQGSHVVGGIPLRKVFVDLPISERPVSMLEAEDAAPRTLFVQTLLRQKSRPLRCAEEPIAAALQDEQLQQHLSLQRGEFAQGFIVIGGPGQGKSTIGQLVCQLHRAALLQPALLIPGRLTNSQRDALIPFTDELARKELGWPEAPLLPLRVVLPEATEWLLTQEPSPLASQDGPPALMRFLVRPLGQRASVDALIALLSKAPVLLVLDALDEVGALADRTLLLDALRALLRFLGQTGVHGLVVATTRPQGYTGELARIGLALPTVYLAPLRRAEALHYGRRLADAKLGDQPEVHTRVLRGLDLAAKETATARLLVTPLQVTILAALVQRRGRVPKDRWGLFERYFETIYEREIERNTYASPLLSDHQTQIRQLHERAGLLLQVEFERGGGGEARLSAERLRQIAAQILEEDGVDEETTAELLQRILRAAAERLVFLVEPEPGRFGFEIRSLQEFMAAGALGSRDEERTLQRLRQIASAPTFRAVALFLASRAYSEALPLRTRLAEDVCAPMDQDPGDTAGGLLRSGAMLALEMLEEGSVLNQPRFGGALLEVACGLLDIPPGPEHQRLAVIASRLQTPKSESDRLRIQLEEAAALGPAKMPPAAWVVLAEMANQGVAWAVDQANNLWSGLESANQLLESFQRLKPGVWLEGKVLSEPGKVSPKIALRLDWEAGWLGVGGQWLFDSYENDQWIPLFKPERGWRDFLVLQDESSEWRVWALAAEFALHPDIATLARFLRGAAETARVVTDSYLCSFAPWPLAACLRSAQGANDLLRFAQDAEAGILGDHADWRRAEEAWSKGKTKTKIHPFPWSIQTLIEGPPLGSLRYVPTAYFPLVDLLQMPSSALRNRLLENSLAFISMTQGRIKFPSFSSLQSLLQEAHRCPADILFALGSSPQFSEWCHGLAHLAHVDSNFKIYIHSFPGIREFVAFINACRNIIHGNDASLIILIRKVIIASLHWHPGPDLQALRETLAFLPKGQIDADLLRLLFAMASAEEFPALVAQFSLRARQQPSFMDDLFYIIENSLLPAEHRETLLVLFLQSSAVSQQYRRWTIEQLREIHRRRRSGLSDPATWDRLGLPLPRPEAPATGSQTLRLSDQPVALSRIELRRIRGIAELTLDLAPPVDGQGQWAVLLGPNGAGKTSVLRAVALALRDLSNTKIWPEGALQTRNPWGSSGGSGPSSILVQVASGGRGEVTFHRNGSETFKQDLRERPGAFPLFAYGCRRGSALGGASRAVKTDEDGGPEIATLFNEGAALIHAETWLSLWSGAAARNPAPAREGVIYDSVLTALRALLAVDEVKVVDLNRVVVSGPSVGKDIPLEALSDGYLTTAGWFLDLIARWVALAERYKTPVSPDFLQRMTGLCLLDEIDLHLHPRWQLEVIPRVRKLLPRMSFLVTTHNPLTLVGARPEEIWVLSREGDAVRAVQGTEVPMLLTGGQLYSRYFDIQDIYPHEIGEALRRYGFLATDPRRRDEQDAELRALQKKLQDHGVDPGWEPVPREAPPPRPASRPRTTKGRSR